MDKRLLREARTARRAFALSVGLSLVIGALMIGQAHLLSTIIDDVYMNGRTLADVSALLLALAALIVGRGLATWGSSASAHFVAVQVKSDLRRRLLAHLLALGPVYARGERSGELVNTATEGVESLHAYFADYLPGLFTAALVPLLILLVVFPVDLLTGVVLLVTAPLIPLFMILIGRVAGSVARRQYGALSRMSAHFLDVMQGLTTLKLFNRSQRQVETIRRITDQFRETTMGVLRIAFISALALELLATLSVAIVAVEVGVRLLGGGLPFQQALFLLVLAPDYYLPLRALGAKFHAGTEGAAAAERIFAILETPGPPQPTQAQPVPADLRIRFDDVRLAYDQGERPALNGVTFALPPGQRVALVGPSGGGKSTIAGLLLRFLEPDSGVIHVGDVPLHHIDAAAWRQQIAWVPQQPYLFNASIADNIRLGRPDAPLDAVMAAARQAGAHEFINALPQGYDTIAGERGARLSGGQAQRIAIARAFLKDAPLLLLDEATSSLDPETESVIEATLARLMQGRTSLVIAHRLSTVYQADHILVLAAGRIVDQGAHDELLARSGVYRDLVSAYGEAKP